MKKYVSSILFVVLTSQSVFAAESFKKHFGRIGDMSRVCLNNGLHRTSCVREMIDYVESLEEQEKYAEIILMLREIHGHARVELHIFCNTVLARPFAGISSWVFVANRLHVRHYGCVKRHFLGYLSGVVVSALHWACTGFKLPNWDKSSDGLIKLYRELN